MEQVRVNLSIEQEVWERFSELVPNRKKSKIINELLKKEIKNIVRRNEDKELRLAFQEASKDTQRLKTIKEWESLDTEGWD
jgi:hypothetical protein